MEEEVIKLEEMVKRKEFLESEVGKDKLIGIVNTLESVRDSFGISYAVLLDIAEYSRTLSKFK